MHIDLLKSVPTDIVLRFVLIDLPSTTIIDIQVLILIGAEVMWYSTMVGPDPLIGGVAVEGLPLASISYWP